MKLIILSDLHFKENNNWDNIKKITYEMIRKIKNIFLDNERLLFVILGDIISGDKADTEINVQNKYAEADKFIYEITTQYSNSSFLFVPGNHDVFSEDLLEFNNFINKHSYKNCTFTLTDSIHSFLENKMNLILVDSNLKRNYSESGIIDEELLKNKLEANFKNLIFMHHPPCLQEMNDGSSDKSILNSSDLISTHCNFVFYGHQHGGHKVLDCFQKDTDIHGVGSFLVRASGVLNDFILLDIEDGNFRSACRYSYSGAIFVKSRMFPAKKEIKSHTKNFDKAPENKRLKHPITRYYTSNKLDSKQDIFTMLKYENKIMISGIAGVGKSYELQNIYWQFKDNGEYFPIWLNLKNASCEYVKECIDYARENTIDNKDILLIVDGLSEVSGDMVGIIIKELSSATRGDFNVKIIVSKRDNFIISLDDFKIYYLQPFENNDIVSYAKQNEVEDIDDFLKCLSRTSCREAVKTPFYLVEIVELYKQNKNLPEFQNLMDSIIRKRLIDSDQKLNKEYTKTLMTNEHDLRYSVQELGFMMQAINKPSLDNLYYTQMFTTSIRELQKDTGFLRINEHTYSCEFEHDIIREYFVACFLYSLPLTELQIIISCDSAKKKPRLLWNHIIDNILQMRKSEDLFNWILEHDQDYFYQFESHKISTDKKDQMAITILNDIFSKNLPIHTVYNNVEKFTEYFESEVVLEFVITRLKDKPNQYVVSSIVQILRYTTQFYNKQDILHTLLIEMLKSQYPEYIFSFTLKALANVMSKNIDKLVDDLVPLIQNKNEIGIIKTFFEILSKSNCADKYIDFAINEYENADRSINYLYFDEAFFNVMYSLKKIESILKCIKYMCKSDVFSRAYHSDNAFKKIIDGMVGLYSDSSEIVFNNMYEIFLDLSGKCFNNKIKIVKDFFIKTHSLDIVFTKMINEEKDDSTKLHFALENIMDPSLSGKLVQHYIDGMIDKNLYIWYASRQPITSSDWEILNNAYKKIEGEFIERVQPIDWQKNEREGVQKYFNSLFSKDDFNKLIGKLIEMLGEDIVIGTYFDDHFSQIPHDHEELQLVGIAIYHSGFKDIPLSMFIERINWESFHLIKIFEFIQSKTELKITDEQRSYIKRYFEKTINENDFSEIGNTNVKNDEKMWHAHNIVMLIKKLEFTCPDETLLQMLALPWYIFDSSSSTGESPALEFISERISDKELLRERIVYNINHIDLTPLEIQTHILYCLDNNISDAVDISVKLFYSTDEEAQHRKNTAVDYLIKYQGDKFVDNLVKDTCDLELLRYLAHTLRTDNLKLISILLKANAQSNNKMLFVSDLIKLNNCDGIQIYLDYLYENNAIPEYKENPDSAYSYAEVTRSIRDISDISLLEQVKQLIVCAHRKNFKDIETWGLKGNLYYAISNLYHIDKMRVSEMLALLIKEYADNDELMFSCNYHLKRIEELDSIIDEKPWTFDKSFDYIQKRRCQFT